MALQAAAKYKYYKMIRSYKFKRFSVAGKMEIHALCTDPVGALNDNFILCALCEVGCRRRSDTGSHF